MNKEQAIDALKAQLSKEGTTSDTINRQQAIDIVVFECGKWTGLAKEISKQLKQLSSAQPEQHEGYWIPHEGIDGGEQYECSECGVLWEFNDGTPEDNEAFYCPKCGVKMKGEQDGH